MLALIPTGRGVGSEWVLESLPTPRESRRGGGRTPQSLGPLPCGFDFGVPTQVGQR